jgi:dynamin 1-like protein
MPQNLLGIGNLTTKLTRILFTHIKHSLPDITREIKDKIKETEDDLRDLGPPMPGDSVEKMQILYSMITDFIQSYKNAIGGRYDSKKVMGQKQELSGGAKIKMNFYNLYSDLDGFKACADYNDLHIQKAIQLHEGDGLPGFPSVDVFVFLITPKLQLLKDPALDLVNESYAQLEFIASTIVNKIFQRFPQMVPEIMDIIVRCLSADRDRAKEVVEYLIDSEENYLFTNDREYKDNRQDIVQPSSDNLLPSGDMRGEEDYQEQNTDRRHQTIMKKGGTNQFVNEMRKRIDQYFSIVLRSVKDAVPKAIGHFLVRKSQDSL